MVGDIEELDGFTPTDVGGSSEWTSVVNIGNLCKVLDGKLSFIVLYDIVFNDTERSEISLEA
jgi:hypothetical protein